MRFVTEVNAKVITETLQEKIDELKCKSRNSLRLQNKIRLMQLALKELQSNKINKNDLKNKS